MGNYNFIPPKVTAILADESGQNVSLEQGMRIRLGDSPSIDAFSRLRVSNPQTIFDSKNIFKDPLLSTSEENLPLFYDNQEISGTGTTTTYNLNQSSQSLGVSATTAGTRVRQTKMRFNYQPGKSQLVIMTLNLDGMQAGITKRIGYFDEKNGLFLQTSGTTLSVVKRTYTSGGAVDAVYNQADWNIDKLDGTDTSGIAIDTTKTQILIIDFQWLGVGRVRFGFDIDGLVYYFHEIDNSNILPQVYISTPNLPLRSEITNDGTGVSSTITTICSSVMSEGGHEDIGAVRYKSTEGTHITGVSTSTAYAVLGIRLKPEYIGATIRILTTELRIHSTTHKCEWFLAINPTIAGTFTYTGETQSAVEIARGSSANTVTGGYKISGGFVESGGVQVGNAGSAQLQINNALSLGSLIDDTRDYIVLCGRPIDSSVNVLMEGSLIWREIT